MEGRYDADLACTWSAFPFLSRPPNSVYKHWKSFIDPSSSFSPINKHHTVVLKLCLDLIDRMPDELWMEVHNTVQETGIKTIPMEKKCKKAKWLSEEVLQIAVKRREVKSKGEKERYTHLNAEFQRIVGRDKNLAQ